ncbi:helix-turn-helix domain-containing protein [Streptomyces sp. NPDC005727]|uniref:helix-turn-helix domain-containing protein n=1 Tax=Streptomyces sp. NPDC005727 TaxID=3157053 RepID=UPI0033FA9C82
MVLGEQEAAEEALSELRRRLEDGQARARLTKTQLALKAEISRTTVHEALRPDRPVPSPETVAALAKALKLPVDELLEVRRRAAAPARPTAENAAGPGRPLSACDPHDLEVHPAGAVAREGGMNVRERRVLPRYVRRQHDGVLADAVREAAAGHSGMVVLVGTSSTGKTRACWEAVQPLAALGWRLWHPFDPTRAEAALEDLHRVGPRTVVWLNEAQHYLGDPTYGERIAAAVHHLLSTRERAPILILGTLWPEYADRYTALPAPDRPDPHSRVRELLSARRIPVPDIFDTEALATAKELAEAGDVLMADALSRAGGHGRIAQDLAGAPELLRRYEDGSPPARAILEAAMDARRLGVGPHLPQAFLTDAALDYLSEPDYQQLSDDWAEAVYAKLTQPVHGKQAPLVRVRHRPRCQPPLTPSCDPVPMPQSGQIFRLADYLEQHGHALRRAQCPPASFWYSAHTHLTNSDDLSRLSDAARQKHRLQWARHLLLRAADAGNTRALRQLALMRENTGDQDGAEALAGQIADTGNTLFELALMREDAGNRQGAEALAVKAAHAGKTDAVYRLAEFRERARPPAGVEALMRRAADTGHTAALLWLAKRHEQTGDRRSAEALLRQAADAGSTDALRQLAKYRENAGDRSGAEALLRQAADAGDPGALYQLTEWRDIVGDRAGAEALALQADSAGRTDALRRLVEYRETAGNQDGAEALAFRAAKAGSTNALHRLALLRYRAGDRESGDSLMRQAAEAGNADALHQLALIRMFAGDQASAESLMRRAANAGNIESLYQLAEWRQGARDWEDAEALLRQAAGTTALYRLARRRDMAGDQQGAETLALRVHDRGNTLFRLAEWRLRAGRGEDAEALLRQAVNAGSTGALSRLVRHYERAGNWERAEALLRKAADTGNAYALHQLALLQEYAGEQDDAEALVLRAAEAGRPRAPYELILMRHAAGDKEGIQALLRRAADSSNSVFAWALELEQLMTQLWPYGLDPDGSPTAPWR